MKETKHYWQSLEERSNPTIENWKTPEFEYTLKEMLEYAKNKKLSRKDFMKFMGASAIMLQAACRRPTEQIVPAIIQSPEYVPGEKLYYASATPEGTGIIVHVREGRPIKIAGNPDHPLTKGGVTANEVASLLDLYDPDRLRYPVRIENKKKKKVKREEIINEIQSKIEANDFVLITGPIQSPSSRKIIQAFLKQFPKGKHLEFRPDPSLRQIKEGQKVSYGQETIPFYRFDKANFVVAIECDFLGTLPGTSIYTRAFTEKRNLNYQKRGYNSLVVFESMYTVTGSNAEHRYPIKPGDAYIIALSIAAELNNQLKVGPYVNNANIVNLLNSYLPDKIKDIVGIDPAVIKSIAKELFSQQGKSIVISGSPLASDGTLNTQIAVNLINSILGNDGKTIDYNNAMQLSAGNYEEEIVQVLEQIKNKKIKTVLLANANLVYHLPPSLKVEEILKNADYVVSFSDRIDETGWVSKAVLPLSHYLESWGDVELVKGVLSVIQPTIRPLYDTLSFEDYLIQIAYGSLGDVENFHQFIKKEWNEFAKKGFTKFWIEILQAGYYTSSKLPIPEKSREFKINALNQLPKEPKSSSSFRIGLFYNVSVLDGTGANNSYRQELPDPVTKIVWTNYAAILPETARKLKLKQGSIVEIKTKEGTVKLPLQLQPGIHPEAILIPLGYGRTSAGNVGNNIGDNALKIASYSDGYIKLTALEPEIQNNLPFKVTGERIVLPCTQVVYRTGRNTEHRAFFAPGSLPNAPYDGSSQYDRQLVLETTYKDYNNGWKSPKQTIEYPENAALMPEWKYDDVRWHMVIDLNLCTGCGACVTSCNIENNIPTVGPEEVTKGREMHWLRIDRYYSGEEGNPEVVHQPMLCQHCENAPCENVCPVGATSHSDDGLNVMVYNRCIGTRYCANNCPYKVRRFNWFENWDYMEGALRKIRDPQQLALNPDVTVRRRGVIEKCTFCIQRLNRARQDAKIKGIKIADGSVKTACQEVCPANAIYFGNILDPESEVSQLVKNGRGYKVLDFLGVKPSITYLAKVRNPVL